MVEPTKNHQKGCNKQHHNLCVFLIFMGPLGPRSPPVDRWLMIPELLKKRPQTTKPCQKWWVSSGNQTWPMDNSL